MRWMRPAWPGGRRWWRRIVATHAIGGRVTAREHVALAPVTGAPCHVETRGDQVAPDLSRGGIGGDRRTVARRESATQPTLLASLFLAG